MTLRQLLRIVEIRTKIVSVSGLAIGISYTWFVSGPPPLPETLLLSSAVLAVDMATTGFNTFFDFFTGVDSRSFNLEADKVLIHEDVAAGPALLVSLLLYLLASVLGLVLAIRTSLWLIPIGAICMLVGFAYNAGPLPISRTPLGELFAGGFLGWALISLIIWTLHPPGAPVDSLLIGLPSLLMVASILTVNNTCDMQGDQRSGRKTLTILIGHNASQALIYVLGALSYIVALVLAFRGVIPASGSVPLLFMALFSVPIYFRMHRRGYSHATKGSSMGSISLIFVHFSVGYLSAIWMWITGL